MKINSKPKGRTTMKHNRLFHNLKSARPAFLAALMLITFAVVVIPASAQSAPVPTVEAQAVLVGVAPDGVTPSATTSRATCLFKIHGTFLLFCNHPGINDNSTVVEAISEYQGSPTNRIMGRAPMLIYNIRPYNGGVESFVDVNSGSDLDIRLDVLIAN